MPLRAKQARLAAHLVLFIEGINITPHCVEIFLSSLGFTI